mmetsp:Transcript_26789/g.74823  ORF Transcript_26789/g.74823 Transcript_26789/m.74823 type:complete len:389 (+) Transcript_26789:3-1169(+)
MFSCLHLFCTLEGGFPARHHFTRDKRIAGPQKIAHVASALLPRSLRSPCRHFPAALACGGVPLLVGARGLLLQLVEVQSVVVLGRRLGILLHVVVRRVEVTVLIVPTAGVICTALVPVAPGLFAIVFRARTIVIGAEPRVPAAPLNEILEILRDLLHHRLPLHVHGAAIPDDRDRHEPAPDHVKMLARNRRYPDGRFVVILFHEDHVELSKLQIHGSLEDHDVDVLDGKAEGRPFLQADEGVCARAQSDLPFVRDALEAEVLEERDIELQWARFDILHFRAKVLKDFVEPFLHLSFPLLLEDLVGVVGGARLHLCEIFLLLGHLGEKLNVLRLLLPNQHRLMKVQMDDYDQRLGLARLEYGVPHLGVEYVNFLLATFAGEAEAIRVRL